MLLLAQVAPATSGSLPEWVYLALIAILWGSTTALAGMWAKSVLGEIRGTREAIEDIEEQLKKALLAQEESRGEIRAVTQRVDAIEMAYVTREVMDLKFASSRARGSS